jgi:predicted Zn-dependent protease
MHAHLIRRRWLIAAALLAAGTSAAPAQQLIAPAEIVLYLHADLKRTDFVRPLVCALQRVLAAPVSTRTSSLRLGRELLANPAQFDVSKVADRFIQATAADGGPQSFRYLLVAHDLKSEPWRYVFSTSFGNETTPYHAGVLSTFRLDAGNRGSEITAMRAYKLILKSIARVAGLKTPGGCILDFPRSLDELDRKSFEFCPDDRAMLVKAGILNEKDGQQGTDCLAVARRGPVDLQLAAARASD